MKDELITFETARLAKEKEFAYEFNKQLPDYVPIFYCESDNDDNLDLTTLRETECQGEDIERCDFYFRSTQSLLQKWLRDKYDIHIEIKKNVDGYSFLIYSKHELNGDFWINYIQDMTDPEIRKKYLFFTYEKALEMGLQEALKNHTT